MQQIRAWLARGRAEHGSQALEAAAAALAAALIVLALLAGARTLGPAVEQAFQCAAAVIGGGGGGCGSGEVAVDGTGTPGTNQLTQDPGGFTLLDGLQLGLDVVGLVPGLGELADGANALISLGRGDYAGAALSAAAMIPFAGWAATGGKFARTGVNAADAVNDARRAGDNAGDLGRRADDVPIPCRISALPSGKGPGLASPLLADPCRKPGEGVSVDAKWGDPSSVKAYGHSKSEHGAKRKPQQLKDRAKTTNNNQGHWADDQFIVEAEQRAPLTEGAHVVDFGRPIGRVYRPDGTVVEGVQRAIVVRKADGTIRTSYPIE